MIRLPQLPEDYWSEDPVLRHIQQAANAQPEVPSPDATLGVLLCRVAATVPLGSTLPGVSGSLNYLVALVGPSGSGKSTAHRLARRLLPEIRTELDSAPIGSGEGLVESYLHRKKAAAEKEQRHNAGYFYVDEAETFINADKRDGSTTLSTLRSMWSGSDVGAMNASVDTSRRLKDGTYRFSAAIGFQPSYAQRLIVNDAAGTPQRFLYLSALHRYAPDVPTVDPGPINYTTPREAGLRVDGEIRRFLRDRRREIQRGRIELDPMDSHRDNLQQRTAALLSFLCGGSGDVTDRYWNLAQTLVETSSGIVAALREDLARQEVDARERAVEDSLVREELRHDGRTDRICRLLGKYAGLSDKPSTADSLVRRLNFRDRPHASLDEAIDRGYLKRDENGYYMAGPRAAAV